jgi:hypothetical protein
MERRTFLKALAATSAALVAPRLDAQTQSGIMVPVLTRGYDNARSGHNLKETILNQSNVKTRGVRKYFTLFMEGDRIGAEASPLIVPSFTCADGSLRDVIITCSMNNTVWMYDANSSDMLWEQKVGIPINQTNTIDMWGINDHWGILSTPVIDPATNYLYLVSWESPDGTPQKAAHYVHVLRLLDGSRVTPAIPLAGISYTPPNGKTQTWSSIMRKQRSSLLLTNVNGVTTVFFACGTVSETSTGAAGWIVAVDGATHTVSAALSLTSGDGGGIWMAGSGLCADSQGNLYGVTGNGDFDGVNDFSECVFRAHYTPATSTAKAKLAIVDWWAPYTDAGRLGENPTQTTATKLPGKLAGVDGPSMPVNMVGMPKVVRREGAIYWTAPNPADAGWSDEDLGSGGLTIMEDYGYSFAAGKDGILYVNHLSNMGKTVPQDFLNPQANFAKLAVPPLWFTYFPGYNLSAQPSDPTQLNFEYMGKTRHLHSTPVWFDSSVHGRTMFCWGENSPLRAWQVAKNGQLSFLAQGAEIASAAVTGAPGGMPGGFMCLSCNGSLAGTAIIVASIPLGDANKSVTNGRLLIYDAENFVNGQIMVLWDSQQWGITYQHNKFNPPVVDGGKIFLTTYNDGVDVYGLS